MILSPRLRALMDAALQYRITEIVAPAGFGKSTVISSCAVSREFSIARVRPGKEPALALLQALCEAIACDAPDLSRTLLSAHANAVASNATSDLAKWFLQWLPSSDRAIAVDDLHYLGQDPTAWHILREILESSSGKTQWMLASRTWLQLPSVAWIANGMQGHSIQQNQLAFDKADVEFTATSLGLGLTTHVAAQIIEATRGWPLLVMYALRLLCADNKPSTVIGAIRGRGIEVFGEGLLSTLSVDDQRLLVEVALCDEALPELLERINPGATRALIRLTSAGVPLMQGNDRRWRLHDVLKSHVLERDPATSISETERLCTALEALESFHQALEVAISGKSTKLVQEILERHVGLFADGGTPQLLQRALGLFLRRVIDASPKLSLLRGILEGRRGDNAAAVALFRRAVELSEGGDRTYALARLGLGLMNWQGHASEGLDILSAAAESVLPEAADEACEVLGSTALGLAIVGKTEEALKQIDRAIQLLPRTETPLDEARAYWRAAQVCIFASRLEEGKRFLQYAIDLCNRFSLYDILVRLFDTGKHIWSSSNEAEAMECARQQAVNAARTFDTSALHYAEASLFAGLCRAGEIEEAKALSNRLLPVPENRRQHFEAVLYSAGALLAMLENDLDRAERLLHSVTVFGEDALHREIMPLRELAWYCNRSVLFQLRRSPLEALRSAKKSLSLANSLTLKGATLSGVLELEIAKICCAAIFGINGRISEAQPILDDMAANAHELYRRDLARWVSELIADPAAEPSPEARTRANGIITLLQRCAAAIETASLTPAERRVLGALAEGRSTKEIAAATGRSSKTVNNIVSSILRKLNARSRGEAVARARRRGLLDEEREPTPV